MVFTFAMIVLNPGEVIPWLVTGLIGGWLAGVVTKARGSGDLGDLIMGLIGGFLGGLLVSMFVEGSARFWVSIIVAFFGACALITALRLISNREKAWRL